MDSVIEEHKDLQEKNELLWWAAARGLLPDAQELVASGADPACKDKQGRAPAHYAAAHGHTAVLEFLATKGVDLDGEDSQGRGALHYAALGDYADTVKWLCDHGAWVDAPDGADDTPLHLAARGLPPSVDALSVDAAASTAARSLRTSAPAAQTLVKAGAKLDVRNSRGLTPLGEAVVWNNAGAVAVLLDTKALATVTIKGYTLLHVAAGLGHTECLERLIVEGRRPDTDSADNPEGITPLHAALQQEHLACAQLLLNRGANASVPDSKGRPPHDLLPTNPPTNSAAGWTALKQRLEKAARTAGAQPNPATAKTEQTKETAKKPSADESESQLTPQERFRQLDRSAQLRKVMAFTALSDSELSERSFPPPEALSVLQALRKTHSVHTCWEAVTALRRDTQFQEDATDPHITSAWEDLRKPGADPNKYVKDSQVQSVFRKMNKLRGILRQHGQGFTMSLEDLIVKPTGPTSLAETQSHLDMLAQRLTLAQDAAIAAVAGLPPPPHPHPQDNAPTPTHAATASSSTAQASGKQQTTPASSSSASGAAISTATAADSKSATPSRDQADKADDDDLLGSAKKANGQGGAVRRKGARDKGGSSAQDGTGAAGTTVGEPLEAVEEGSEEPLTWGEFACDVLKSMGWHALRALFSACLMIFVMWIMGMLPDQVVQRRGEQDDALNTKLQEQLLSSVENGLGLSGGSGQAAGLEGLAENA